MSVADCRASRRKMMMRYGHAHKRDVAAAIEAEKRKIARAYVPVKKKRS